MRFIGVSAFVDEFSDSMTSAGEMQLVLDGLEKLCGFLQEWLIVGSYIPADTPAVRWRGCVRASHQSSQAQRMNLQADFSTARRLSQIL